MIRLLQNISVRNILKRLRITVIPTASESKWIRLKFAAMNLKNFAIHKWDRRENRCILMFFTKFAYIFC